MWNAGIKTIEKGQQFFIREKRISGNPVWLSISGLGVYWLRIRLDARPKYYQHLPYKNEERQ